MTPGDVHSEDREWLDEQIAYYRARAPEYDRTSMPSAEDARNQEAALLRDALDQFAPGGHVLEIACGTGQWTTDLIRQPITSITALDSAPEMIEIAKSKVDNDARVRFIEADFFSWASPSSFDVIFFANFLSHVPPRSLAGFWDRVRSALAPGGRVFFVDEREDVSRRLRWSREALPLEDRELLDGRVFRAVKVYWDPGELEGRLREMGWDISLTPTGDSFYWGQGSRETP